VNRHRRLIEEPARVGVPVGYAGHGKVQSRGNLVLQYLPCAPNVARPGDGRIALLAGIKGMIVHVMQLLEHAQLMLAQPVDALITRRLERQGARITHDAGLRGWRYQTALRRFTKKHLAP